MGAERDTKMSLTHFLASGGLPSGRGSETGTLAATSQGRQRSVLGAGRSRLWAPPRGTREGSGGGALEAEGRGQSGLG